MLMAFFEKRVNEHWKICEISPISRFWILTVQIIFEIKKPLEGKILNYNGKNIHK